MFCDFTKKSKKVSILSIVLVGGLLIFACGSSGGIATADSLHAKGQSNHTTKVLAILPETGPEASVSFTDTKGSYEAVQTLWEQEHKGQKIDITYCNDQGTSQGAISCVDQYGGSADVIDGPPFQDEYLGAKPLLERLGKVDTTGDPFALPSSGTTLFQAIPTVKDAVDAGLGYMKQRGWTNIGVLTTTDAIGTGAQSVILAAAKAQGFKVTSEQYADTAQSIVPQVSAMEAGHPQAVFIWSAGPQVATALQSLKASGVSLPVMLNFASASRSLVKLAGSSVPKTLLFTATKALDPTSVTNPQQKQLDEKFTSIFHSKMGVDPSWDALAGGDSMIVALEAAAHGSSGAAMTKYLEGGSPITGMVAVFKYSRYNHLGLSSNPITIMQWRGSGFAPASK